MGCQYYNCKVEYYNSKVRWSELSLNNTAHSQTVAMQWRKISGNGSTHSDAVSSANTL